VMTKFSMSTARRSPTGRFLLGPFLSATPSGGNETEVNAWADDVVRLGEDYVHDGRSALGAVG
jgi:hypothetical protein